MNSSGGVLVTGPKFCGKTTTCMRFQKSYIKLNTNQVISLVSMNPRQALAGEKPRLIDEWQKVPDVWNNLQYPQPSRMLSQVPCHVYWTESAALQTERSEVPAPFLQGSLSSLP